MSPVPRISVLLPCRDAGRTLDEAVASLVAQTMRDFEIIAIDDGSVDDTATRLAEWSLRDDRIHYLRTQPGGIVAALNRAAAEARGALLARMDADDICLPTRFARQAELLDAQPELAACGTGVRYVPAEHVREGARRYEAWINSVVSSGEIDRDLFVECPIPHPTLMVRRDAYERVGGYRDPAWPEDYDLVLRLRGAGYRLGKVPEVLLEWRESDTRLSRVDDRYGEDAFRRCKVHYLASRIAGREVVVWGAGPVGKAFARALQDEGHTIAAFVDLDPRKVGQIIHGARVVEPSDIPRFERAYVVAAVGSAEARADIRSAFAAAGLQEPADCCAVA